MALDWSNLSVRLYTAGRVRWNARSDPTWKREVGHHDLWVIWAGHAVLHGCDGPINLGLGTCTWLRPGWPYTMEQSASDPLGMSFIQFQLLRQDGSVLPHNADLPPEQLCVIDPIAVEVIARHIVEVLWLRRWPRPDEVLPFHPSPDEPGHVFLPDREADPGTMDTASSLLRGLLVELDATSRIDPSQPPSGKSLLDEHLLVRKAIHRLQTEMVHPPTVHELAREARCSADHFTRLFRQLTGVTPKDYLVRIRVQRAKELLVQSGASVSQVAAELGYCDSYFFSRQFKSRTGLSPRHYLAHHKQSRHASTLQAAPSPQPRAGVSPSA